MHGTLQSPGCTGKLSLRARLLLKLLKDLTGKRRERAWRPFLRRSIPETIAGFHCALPPAFGWAGGLIDAELGHAQCPAAGLEWNTQFHIYSTHTKFQTVIRNCSKTIEREKESQAIAISFALNA